jgi:branched-chain amino acid transport system ATP-binding protein
MTPALEITGLRKRFGTLPVTDGVDLKVTAGCLHALIGPNGAGKTSLIGQITGTLRPDDGKIWLHGRDVTHAPPHLRARLGLARSFQITALAGGLTALENVALAVQGTGPRRLSPFGSAASDARLNAPAQEALGLVGLASRARTLARHLSHGERRSLELACALAMRPVLLVLDEPLAGMGMEEGAAIVSLLQGLKGKLTILLVEHDMSAVFSLADQLSVLVAGRIIASGQPAEIRANASVREAYLGEIPC